MTRKENKACTMAHGAAFAVTGVIIGVLGFHLMYENIWLQDLFKPKVGTNLHGIPNTIQVLSYIICVLVIAFGLLVVPTVLRRKPLCVCCYICWVSLAVITMLVTGLPLLFFYSFRENSIEKFCEQNFEMVPTRYGQEKAK